MVHRSLEVNDTTGENTIDEILIRIGFNNNGFL